MNEIIYQALLNLAEPVYFSLFLIIGKNIKSKRLLFTVIMSIQYLILMCIFPFKIWFHIIYTFISFVNLKVLYKEKALVTDIFLFAISSLVVVLVSIFTYTTAMMTYKNFAISLLLNRFLLFAGLFLFRNKIKTAYKNFCLLWNRHNNPKKIRSLTLRNISIITFNLMFWVINLCMAIRFALHI